MDTNFEKIQIFYSKILLKFLNFFLIFTIFILLPQNGFLIESLAKIVKSS